MMPSPACPWMQRFMRTNRWRAGADDDEHYVYAVALLVARATSRAERQNNEPAPADCAVAANRRLYRPCLLSSRAIIEGLG